MAQEGVSRQLDLAQLGRCAAQRMQPKKTGRGKIVDAVTISERPPSVEDTAIPGYWEGDVGRVILSPEQTTAIPPHWLNDRRLVMLAKDNDKTNGYRHPNKTGEQIASRVIQITHVESWLGAGRPQAIYRCNQY